MATQSTNQTHPQDNSRLSHHAERGEIACVDCGSTSDLYAFERWRLCPSCMATRHQAANELRDMADFLENGGFDSEAERLRQVSDWVEKGGEL